MCYKIHDRHGVSLLTKLRVEFSDLRAHRFAHNFNCVSPICVCGKEDESTEHYLTRCPRFDIARELMISSLSEIINPVVRNLPDDHLTEIMLFGSKVYNIISNKLIIETTITYIKRSTRFKSLEAFANN